MAEGERCYIAIDLKSFYASVECVERHLDPLTTNLVVADKNRTEKTICLAVSPSLKAYGIPGRARLFEVVQRVREVNALRRGKLRGRDFISSSWDDRALRENPALAVDYITAPPRMAHYIQYSAKIYNIYLQYIAPEDIHVYSIDEVFLDATRYLELYRLSPRELARKLIQEVLDATGVTATAGIGTNLYLCKIAMDIVAKHIKPDKDGVRIAQLSEASYRRLLWSHRPLTDFWRVGRGTARKLEAHGLYTMGDVARCSLGQPGAYHSEALLYKLFGVNAELLIDHAWGWEPCTIADIKTYRPESSSICSGQVLTCPYPCGKAGLVAREMADLLALELVDKGLCTDQLTLTLGYDAENLSDPARRAAYRGAVTSDHYGRAIPKHAHGTVNFDRPTASAKEITGAVAELFSQIADEKLLVRRLTLTANRLITEQEAEAAGACEQLDLFTDPGAREAEEAARSRERSVQEAVLQIKKKYGKNAILKGMNLQEGATAKDRNTQIGGHRA